MRRNHGKVQCTPWVLAAATEGRKMRRPQAASAAASAQTSAAASHQPSNVAKAPAATMVAKARGIQATAGRKPAKMGNQRVLKPKTKGARKAQAMSSTRRPSQAGGSTGP